MHTTETSHFSFHTDFLAAQFTIGEHPEPLVPLYVADEDEEDEDEDDDDEDADEDDDFDDDDEEADDEEDDDPEKLELRSN